MSREKRPMFIGILEKCVSVSKNNLLLLWGKKNYQHIKSAISRDIIYMDYLEDYFCFECMYLLFGMCLHKWCLNYECQLRDKWRCFLLDIVYFKTSW